MSKTATGGATGDAVKGKGTYGAGKDGKASFGKGKPSYGGSKGGKGGGPRASSGDGKAAAAPVALTRQERKEQSRKRKEAKPHGTMVQEAKKIWDKLRRRNLNDISAEETAKTKVRKQELVGELLDLIRGHVYEVVVKHDASRIVQCALKFGTAEQRREMCAELNGHYAELAMATKYSQYLVMRALKYGDKQVRAEIIGDIKKFVRKMAKHRDASIVLEYAYAENANAAEQLALVQEFYGPSFTLAKIGKCKSLAEAFEMEPNSKSAVLKSMGDLLNDIISKGILGLSLVHRVLAEFFEHASEATIVDFCRLIGEHFVDLVHTKEGARILTYVLHYASAKEKKKIIKGLKTHVKTIATHEHGHLVMQTLLATTDDTVLLSKAILGEVGDDLLELALNKYGKRVLLWILVLDDKAYFHPDVRAACMLASESANYTFKKDKEVRTAELTRALAGPLLTMVRKHAHELITNPGGSQVLLEVLRNCDGEKNEKEKALDAVAELLSVDEEDEASIWKTAFAKRAIMTLIHPIKPGVENRTPEFASMALDAMREGQLVAQAKKGSFVVVRLLEHEKVAPTAIELLADVKKDLVKRAKDSVGNGIIADRLQGKKGEKRASAAAATPRSAKKARK